MLQKSWLFLVFAVTIVTPMDDGMSFVDSFVFFIVLCIA
jgi:hypothetical protein